MTLGGRSTGQGWILPRPDLEARLDAALTHRLTTLVAASGYGKSTLLQRWTSDVGGVVVTLEPHHDEPAAMAAGVLAALRQRVPDLPPDGEVLGGGPLGPSARLDGVARAAALATGITALLGPLLRRHLALALDDLSVVADSPAAVRFVETLVRTASTRLHVVIASQVAMPFPTTRLQRLHDLLRLDATDLALSEVEVARWCEARRGGATAPTAAQLRAATGGWPALVHARLDQLGAGRRATLVGDGPEALHALVKTEFDALPAPIRALLQAATVLPVLHDRLAAALQAPPGALRALTARGLFLDSHPEGHRLNDTSRQVLRRHAPMAPDHAAEVITTAMDWYAAHGHADLALQTALAGGALEAVTDLLGAHGEQLLDQPDIVVAAVEALPEGIQGTPAMQRLAGMAHHSRGDWTQAHPLLTAVAAGPGGDAAVAWRLGFMDHIRGALDQALATYLRGVELGAPAPDATMCTAMAASVRWLQGDRDRAVDLADQAMEQATRLGDPRALAASHTIVAMLAALDGDRRANDAHYRRALEYAQQAGDALQQIRIHSNRASHHQEEGAYHAALAELDVAERLAEATGFSWFLALALSNRAEVLLRLGRLEEAQSEATQAVAHWDRLGSHLIVYALGHVATIQALRGDRAAAIRTHRRALREAEAAGEVHGLVTSLAGLAELLLNEDPQAAAACVDRALDHPTALTGVAVRVAAARVAHQGGQADRARALLREALALAEDRRDRPGAAAATELLAMVERDPVLAQAAIERWADIDDPIGRASAELLLAELGDPELAPQAADAVAVRMHAIGCRSLDDRMAAVRAMVAQPGGSLAINVLGGFQVVRAGVALPRSAWQSRKARDLLKVLVAHRGRPVPREQLTSLLWPDEADQAAATRRLNVQVSTLRTILDPDRSQPSDHVVVSADGALRLDLRHVEVDAERVLVAVADADRLERAGRTREAVARYRAAEVACTGEVLAEDAYADWAVSLREEVRLAYAQAARRLGDVDTRSGRHEAAARLWLRLLEHDPFDEPAHLSLVSSLAAAGRHGDARRRYLVYSDRMHQLGVEPASYPRGDAHPGSAG